MSISAEQLNVKVLGQGPHLLMLHGWNRSLNDLMPLAGILAEHATCHVIDLPGFGKSPPPPEEGWGTVDYARLIIEYIKLKSLQKVSLLGHSFGGRTSLRIVRASPELIDKLVLVDSHGIKPIRSPLKRLKFFLIKKAGQLLKTVDKIFGTTFFKDRFARRFGSPDYLNAGILKNTFIKTISEDQSAELPLIQADTLLIWGSEDTETPVELARRFHTLIKNSRLIILEGKDHSPFHGVGAHLVAHHIVPFLKQNNPSAG